MCIRDSFYSEKRATNRNCYSGKQLPGTLRYNPETFTDLSPMEDHFSREEYPFGASEHKPRFRSISMLSNSPVMRDLCSHNYIELNREDAAELGIKAVSYTHLDVYKRQLPRRSVRSILMRRRAGTRRGLDLRLFERAGLPARRARPGRARP